MGAIPPVLLCIVAAIGFLSALLINNRKLILQSAGVAFAILLVGALINHVDVKNAFLYFLFVYFVPFSFGSWIAKGKKFISRKK